MFYAVGGFDTAIFQGQRNDTEKCKHLDDCGAISAQNVEDGMEVRMVIICGCCGKQVADLMFMKNQDIEISYNTVPIDRSTYIWPNGKCVRLLKRFPTSEREAETPTGHAYLPVKVMNDIMKEHVKISHVITL